MTVPYNKLEDRIGILFDIPIHGYNFISPRLEWNDPSKIDTSDVYISLDTGNPHIFGSWWADAGDLAMDKAAREPRIICRKGLAEFSVDGSVGPTLYLRIFLNPGFGTGKVYINGQPPSTLPWPENFLDEISCDSDFHGSAGNEYIDVLIVDNIPENEVIDVVIEMNNAEEGTGGYFPIAGFKQLKKLQSGGGFDNNLIIDIDNWILPAGTPQNNIGIEFKNITGSLLKSVNVDIPPEFKNSNDLQTVPDQVVTELLSNESLPIPEKIVYDWSTDARQGLAFVNIDSTINYIDPEGDIIEGSSITIDANSPEITTPVGTWFQDNTNGENRIFSDSPNAELTVDFSGDSITIRVQKEFGWGEFDIFVDDVLVGTGSSHDDIGGGFYEDLPTISGLGQGDHVLKIVNTSPPGGYVVLSSFTYDDSISFTQLTERLTLRFNLKHVPPKFVDNIEFDGKRYQLAVNDITEENLEIPYSNVGLDELQIQSRFPTYCVYYSAGKEDILEKYDLVVIDPFAVTRKQVKRLQDKGIIVLAYVSFGEEDSTLEDEFNPSSAHVPYVGDGSGPGGYAGYYAKGGNHFEEISACSNDRQRYEDVKACAELRPEYWTDVGRCGIACTNDFREGFNTYREGGQCSAGFTRDNNWDRTASEACHNSQCPSYTPVNSNCPEFNQATDAWGQDFSIMTQDFPDENGIWQSYFVDVTKLTTDGNPRPLWQQRIEDYYLPILFNGPQEHIVYRQLQLRDIDGENKLVFKLGNLPLDDEEDLEVLLYTSDNPLHPLVSGLDYSYDAKLTTFTVTPPEDQSWTAKDGDYVKVRYFVKGIGADGVFMDTVDTVDVYPSPTFKSTFANMVNDLKSQYPSKIFCSNRGFGILPDIIESCDYVMFETFISEYDWQTGEYYEITDPDTIEFNDSVIDLLISLRESNKFDVLALNYCENGPAGDELRKKIAERCRDLGFLSWTSTILLNDPLPNVNIETKRSIIRNNSWRKLDVLNVNEERIEGQIINSPAGGYEYWDVKSALVDGNMYTDSASSNVVTSDGDLVKTFNGQVGDWVLQNHGAGSTNSALGYYKNSVTKGRFGGDNTSDYRHDSRLFFDKSTHDFITGFRYYIPSNPVDTHVYSYYGSNYRVFARADGQTDEFAIRLGNNTSTQITLDDTLERDSWHTVIVECVSGAATLHINDQTYDVSDSYASASQWTIPSLEVTGTGSTYGVYESGFDPSLYVRLSKLFVGAGQLNGNSVELLKTWLSY